MHLIRENSRLSIDSGYGLETARGSTSINPIRPLSVMCLFSTYHFLVEIQTAYLTTSSDQQSLSPHQLARSLRPSSNRIRVVAVPGIANPVKAL